MGVRGIMWAVILATLAWAKPFKISYYDCGSGKVGARMVSRADLCLGNTPSRGSIRSFEVLQIKQTKRFPGYACKLTKSSLRRVVASQAPPTTPVSSVHSPIKVSWWRPRSSETIRGAATL